MIVRRTRTPAPAAQAKPVIEKEATFRRVWLANDPRGEFDNERPYWYYMAHSREGAINAHARASRKPAHLFNAK